MRTAMVVILTAAICVAFYTAPKAQSYVATIDGAQQVPPAATSGNGFGCFTLSATAPILNFQVSYVGLSSAETASHIHGPAPVGLNTGVIFPLPLGPVKIGSVGPLTAVELADLHAGLWYVNIHTTNFPGGEIRGQILLAAAPCTTPVENKTWGAVKAIYDVTPERIKTAGAQHSPLARK